MRRAFLPLLLCCACGLTARGTGERLGAGDEDVDAGAGADGGAPREDGGGTIDAPVDVVEAAPCDVVVEEDFSTVDLDPAKWLTVKNVTNGDFPKPDFTGGKQLRLLKPDTDSARGAIWFEGIVPFDAFDIELDTIVVCNASPCGDGLAVLWLEPATDTQLADADHGSTFGVPRKLSGGGVSLDIAQNVTPNGDTATPNLAVLDIDGTKTPSTYDWTVSSSGQRNQLQNQGTRRLKLSLRNKQVAVSLDGVVEAGGAMPRIPSEGRFGISASTGAFNADMAIADVRAKFYRCNAP